MHRKAPPLARAGPACPHHTATNPLRISSSRHPTGGLADRNVARSPSGARLARLLREGSRLGGELPLVLLTSTRSQELGPQTPPTRCPASTPRGLPPRGQITATHRFFRLSPSAVTQLSQSLNPPHVGLLPRCVDRSEAPRRGPNPPSVSLLRPFAEPLGVWPQNRATSTYEGPKPGLDSLDSQLAVHHCLRARARRGPWRTPL